MIILTRPDGSKIEARADAITVISPDPNGRMYGHTIVRIDGENHGVMETLEQIVEMINQPLLQT